MDRRPAPRAPRWVVAGAGALLVVAGCAGQPTAAPTIGSPEPAAAVSPTTPTGRGAELARRWKLTGTTLPDDWPDVPLPVGTEVVTAYAIGAQPRRTWTATFAADTGTALDLARPVVAAMRERGYVPIAEYVGAPATNTGLFSFAAPTFAVYLVLGEDEGRPNLVLTVRGTTDTSAGLPGASPTGPPTPGPTRTPTPTPTPTPAATATSGGGDSAGSSPVRSPGPESS